MCTCSLATHPIFIRTLNLVGFIKLRTTPLKFQMRMYMYAVSFTFYESLNKQNRMHVLPNLAY